MQPPLKAHAVRPSGQPLERPTASLLLVASCTLVALLVLACEPALAQEQLTVESRQTKDGDDLSETIKFLDKLDKYFSHISRPRFGRSEYKQPTGRPVASQLGPAGSPLGLASLLELARARQATPRLAYEPSVGF